MIAKPTRQIFLLLKKKNQNNWSILDSLFYLTDTIIDKMQSVTLNGTGKTGVSIQIQWIKKTHFLINVDQYVNI